MRSFLWLFAVLPLVTAIPDLLGLLPELKRTGLTEKQLRSLVEPVSVERATTCDGNLTTIKFPSPTLPSVQDLFKRNAFVTRSATSFCPRG